MSAERTPAQRYEDAVAPGGWLTSAGWERLASDFEAEAERTYVAIVTGAEADEITGKIAVRDGLYTPGRVAKLLDRADDCRRRAEKARAA